MSLVREVVLAAADHLLTVVWLKATLVILLWWPLRGWLGRRPAAARALAGTVAVGVLVLLAGAQHVAWALAPPAGPELLGFPVFLFRLSAADLAGGLMAGRLDDARLLGALARQPLAIWLGAAWLAGALARLVVFACRTRALHRMAATAESLPALSDPRVRVASSAAVREPLTFGWRRPVILLPASARAWPETRLAAVLAHERAHVGRRDYRVLVLTEVAGALFWLNPLVGWLVRDVRAALESACDDAVLRDGMPATHYADHLLALARQHVAAPGAALPALGASAFRARLGDILDAARDRRPVAPGVAAVACALALALTAPLASAAVWACPGSSTPSSQTPTP